MVHTWVSALTGDKEAGADTWRDALLPIAVTIKAAIENLNDSCLQIAIVVDPSGFLVGTITDGDIRRGLLRGLAVESSISEIICRDPLVVPPQLGREVVLQLMRANKIHQLPIVDADSRVVGLHLWDELVLPALRENLMVIMAGGNGARLRPHTETCPKPLLPVGGKPILEHIIERAHSEGFHRFVLAVHYLGSMIEDHFGNGDKWDVSIEYVRESSPMGTAGAIGLINPKPGEAVIVSNGDVLTEVRYGDLLDYHLQYDAIATMAVRLHEWQHPFGVVRTEGVDIIGFEEKPVARSHINAGIYVLDPSALDALPRGERCDMPTLFSRIQSRGGRTVVYPMHELWLDVGRADDLAKAHERHSTGTRDGALA